VKVILETCLLTDDEKVTACQIAERAGARFVKTSTATQPGGATLEDIRLMRKSVSEKVVVKASAYVTTIEKVLALYEAGARRFGTGYTRQILEGLQVFPGRTESAGAASEGGLPLGLLVLPGTTRPQRHAGRDTRHGQIRRYPHIRGRLPRLERSDPRRGEGGTRLLRHAGHRFP
jgi:hypothetical protein